MTTVTRAMTAQRPVFSRQTDPRTWTTRLLLLAAVIVLVVSAVLDLGPVLGIGASANAVAAVAVGLAFTLLHGSAALGVRRLVLFIVVTVAVSFTAEAVGVATGAIFGHYTYTDELGPKLLDVPLAVQGAYVAMGYASLTIARITLGALDRPRRGRVVGIAVVAALVMVAWDIAMDPYQSTVAGDWLWRDGGPWFGVGLHNYAGWFGTVFVLMLVYLALERWIRTPAPDPAHLGRWFWSEPVLYYVVIGVGIGIVPLVGGVVSPIASPANYAGSIDDLQASLSLVAIFVMGTPAVTALVRLVDARPPSADLFTGGPDNPGLARAMETAHVLESSHPVDGTAAADLDRVRVIGPTLPGRAPSAAHRDGADGPGG